MILVYSVNEKRSNQTAKIKFGVVKKQKQQDDTKQEEEVKSPLDFTNLLLRNLLDTKGAFLAHGRNNGYNDSSSRFLVIHNPRTEFSPRNLNVVLLRTVWLDKMHKPILSTDKMTLDTGDIGNVYDLCGRAHFFELVLGEDIDGKHVNVVGTCAYLENLAWATLNDNVAILWQGRALKRVGVAFL